LKKLKKFANHPRVEIGFPRPARRQQKRKAEGQRGAYFMKIKHPPQNSMAVSSDDDDDDDTK
jgi:hypothetical protein